MTPQSTPTAHTQHMRSLLRLPSVLARTGLSRTGLYELIRDGSFAKPLPLTGRSVAWDSFAVDAWIDARIAAAV
jgi:prophage regulatory protein